MDIRLIVLPIVGGVIGWFTNYLAVKMLFRPRQPVGLLGLKIQGLVPRRRPELARSVGEVVEREFISHDDVREALSDPEFIRSLRPHLEERVDAFLSKRVVGGNVWLRAAFSTTAVMKLKELVVDELVASLPEMVEGITANLQDRLHFGELVRSKIEAFEIDRLEETVTRVAGRELKAIEMFGGAIGFAIGLAQAGILVFIE